MKFKDIKSIKINMEHTLKKYFGKQKNIDYILKKTEGADQSLKVYELLCLIHTQQEWIDLVKNDRLLWSHPIFDEEKKKIEEENDFMVCPYEISEGVLTCHKCGCKKIFSFSKQTRSMDEPTTVFGLCSQCGHKWCEGS